MSSPITKAQERKIVELIRNWPINVNLTWGKICEEAESVLDYIPTRQALKKYNQKCIRNKKEYNSQTQ